MEEYSPEQSVYHNPAPLRNEFDKVIKNIPYPVSNQSDKENEFEYRRNRALLQTTYLTAGRISEVISLKSNNFDFFTPNSVNYFIRNMRNLKNKKLPFKLIPIPKDDWYTIEIKEFIEKYIPNPDYYIFYQRKKTFGHSTPNGLKPLHRSTAWRIVSSAGEQAGVKLWCHLLRHYRLSHLANKLTDRELIRLSGHRNSENLEYYVRLDESTFENKIPSAKE